MANSKIIPVILSGGIGSRLWPLSRRQRPKQFIPLTSGRSLFEDTLFRLDNSKIFYDPVIVCAREHRFLVRDIMDHAGLSAHSIIMEPCVRNTAPAIVAAALEAQKIDPDAVIIVLPSDHYIPDKLSFESAIKSAAKKAQDGGYVLFGIKPTKPHTGYGYIQCGASEQEHEGICSIKSFKEKPDLKTAESYLEQGGFVWNSGMFLLNVADFLDDVKTLQPKIYSAVEEAFKNAHDDMGDILLEQKSFESAPSISVDHAIMEKTQKGCVLPVSYSWSDLGSWDSLWDISAKDDNGNALHGDVIAKDTSNSYLRSEGSALLCASGVEGVTVVATDDVILVTKQGETEQVGDLVKFVNERERLEASESRKVYRPWGSYEIISEGHGYKTKRIIVNSGKRLSLQKHKHRSEHWVVVRGVARVTIDDQIFDLEENQSTYIPSGSVHRLENTRDIPLVLIEVQTGSYLGEDDIIRLEDDFGRKKAV